jgi:hypothetical protein
MSESSSPSAPVLDPQTLAMHREKWGLDAAPTHKARTSAKKAKQDRITKIKQSFGTPLDVVRGLMARKPPREWERDLRAISPISDHSSYLIFAWKAPPFAMDDGRWCLYEAIPDALISVERRMELAGAPFWELPKDQRAGQAQIVSAYQWVMYREHRVDVRPFWCLQGSEGGTPFNISRVEQRFLTMMGKPTDPVPLGALPYAPWDARAAQQILERDRLVKFGGSIAKMKASGTSEAVKADVEAQEKEYRRKFWDWFSEKLGPQTELLRYCLQHEDADRVMRPQTREESIAANETRDFFIEHGRVPDPWQFRHKKIAV